MCRSPFPAGSQQGLGTVDVPITFDADDNPINALIFSIDFDEEWLSFDETDSNGDGIPDSVIFNAPAPFSTMVSYDPADTDGELDFALFTVAAGVVMPDGTPVTITFGVGDPAVSTEVAIDFSADPAPSFGTSNGDSVAGGGENGSALIVVEGSSPPMQAVYLPLIQNQ